MTADLGSVFSHPPHSFPRPPTLPAFGAPGPSQTASGRGLIILLQLLGGRGTEAASWVSSFANRAEKSCGPQVQCD